MPEPQQSPLARLVIFMICLAALGSLTAGAHYRAVDLPAQDAALYPPANSESCTPVYTGYCGSRSTICRVGGTDFNWYQSCMKDYGCCV